MDQHATCRCAVCGAALKEPHPYVLYHSEKTQEESFACALCAQQLLTLMQEEEPQALKSALDYFAGHAERIKRMADRDLLAVIAEILEDASARAVPGGQGPQPHTTAQ